MPSINRHQLLRLSLQPFLGFFLLSGSLIVTLVLTFYQLQTSSYLQRLLNEEQHSIRLQQELAERHFGTIISDLAFLADQQELQAYLDSPSIEHLTALQREYLRFSRNKGLYDQIRFLGRDGQEIVRVNYRAGNPQVVPQSQLQKKAERYYFSATIGLGPGQMYVSPFDLNVEHGWVEIPLKPMIRFAAPVFDSSGQKRGIVLLNYLGQQLLELIDEVGAVAHGQTMLLNADGYWLQHPDPEQEWGFMFVDRKARSFRRQQPETWRQMQQLESGQLHTDRGIYSFATLQPLRSTAFRLLPTRDYAWKIVSFISERTLGRHAHSLLISLLGLGGSLLVLAGLASWALALAGTRRKLYRQRLISMAHFDPLTGLANRTLFYDRLEQSIALARRHARQCALLYIDLDGFKQVNDSLGHDSGDELLIAVGKRMQRCCRSSDTLARLGGDEFAVLLAEVNGANGAQVCSESLLKSLAEPFALQRGEARIGASIGIALYPQHGNSHESLLRSADKAMYFSKKQGKNTYTFAGEEVSGVPL